MYAFIVVNTLAILYSVVATLLKNRRIVLFGFIGLFLIISFRVNYGNDYSAYEAIFSTIQQGRFSSLLTSSTPEIGYLLVNYILSPFSFRFFLAFSAFAYLAAFSFFIRKFAIGWTYVFALTILLFDPYLLLTHLSAMRQAYAISIIVFVFSTTRNRFYWVIGIILAGTFHLSSLLLIPIFLFINDHKISKKVIILMISFYLCSILFAGKLFTLSKGILDFLFFQKYEYYLDNIQSGNKGLGLIFRSFIFLLHLAMVNKVNDESRVIVKLSILYYISVPIVASFLMFGRISMYFSPFTIISLPIVVGNIKSPNIRRMVFLVVLFFYLITFIRFCTGEEFSAFYYKYRLFL